MLQYRLNQTEQKKQPINTLDSPLGTTIIRPDIPSGRAVLGAESYLSSPEPYTKDVAIAAELAEFIRAAEQKARAEGLDFYPLMCHFVGEEQMAALAAQHGFENYPPSPRIAGEYLRLLQQMQSGRIAIFEMVVNTDPCQVYLLRKNSLVAQKLVVTHVFGHSDFFKCNQAFAHTRRDMHNEFPNHRVRMQNYINNPRIGLEAFEKFYFACHDLDTLIDIHNPGRRKDPEQTDYSLLQEKPKEEQPNFRMAASDYMDPFVNPPSRIAKLRADWKAEQDAKKAPRAKIEPSADVLQFLIDHAPLQPWQGRTLEMVRDAALYFAPQAQTKIMNEGWATYWQSHMMAKCGMCGPEGLIEYADMTSGGLVQPPLDINPYKLGVELFRHIERTWDEGKHGPDWDRCDDMEEKRDWTKNHGTPGRGREEIFLARRVHTDVSFVDTYLTPEFCQDQKLFVWKEESTTWQDYLKISSRKFTEIKSNILRALSNGGRPIIKVVDSNHANRGELVLRHEDKDGPDLEYKDALGSLESLYYIWGRPVHIETRIDNKKAVLKYSEEGHSKEFIKDS